MNRFFAKNTKRAGFTLIELLLVITIISVLASVIVPKFFGRSQQARIVAAKQTIVGTLGMGLDMFEQDTGRYPRADEGLDVLIQNPQLRGWRGPYVNSARIPLDPWGSEYKYSFPSELTSSEFMFDVVSAGPDGAFGSEDDVTNHEDRTNEGDRRY